MAGQVVGEAFVAIRPQTEGFAQEAQSKITGPLNAAFAGIATGIAAVKIKQFFSDSFGQATEAQKATAQTAAVLKSTGEAAGVSAQHVEAYAQQLSDLAAIDDEVIQGGENVLLTFTSVRNEVGKGNDVFDRATKAALNVSVALGQDLQGSIIQVGKALQDPIQGLTALRRVGVSFTESEVAQIAALQKAGDLLGAQKIILSALETQFGGAAAAQATAAQRLSVAFGNLKESIGTALLPVVSALAKVLTPIATFLTEDKVAATGLAVVLSGALLVGLAGWTAGAVRATAANLGLTASSEAVAVAATEEAASGLLVADAWGTVTVSTASSAGAIADAAGSAEEATGVFSSLGSTLVGVAAGIAAGVASYDLTTRALHRFFDQADKVTPVAEEVAKDVKDIAKANDDQLVPALNRASDAFIRQAKWAFLQTGQGAIPTRVTAQLKVFNDLLDTNEIAAQRVANQFKDHPALYKAMTAAIEKHNQELRNQSGETASLIDWMDILEGKLNDQVDAQLGSQGAAISMDRAIQNLNETLFTNAEGSLEARDALNQAEERVVDFGKKIYDEKLAVEDSTQAARDQVGALEGVRDSLAPSSPLRHFLDEYIFKLASGIPPEVHTIITAETRPAAKAIQDLIDFYSGWQIPLQTVVGASGGFFPSETDQNLVQGFDGHWYNRDTGAYVHAARGGFFPARPGGWMVNVAEAGKDEVVGTEEQMQRLYGGGARGGDTYIFQGIVPANDPVRFGHIAARTLRAHLTMASR